MMKALLSLSLREWAEVLLLITCGAVIGGVLIILDAVVRWP